MSLLCITSLAGCSVKIPKIDLYPAMPESLSAPLSRQASSGLGLIPLEDLRPELQHEGQSPSLWVFLFYNQRRGVYLTGDKHFEAPASQSVTNALADALHGSRFGSARVLNAAPSASLSAGLERCAEEGLRYVGAGSISALYGRVDQNAYLAIIPLPFISFIGFQNSVSDPLGIINLDLEILECETERSLYRRRISRQLRSPEESVTDAVRLTLLDILEQIRNEVKSL